MARSFSASPDPVARRAYLYDRWYDLYQSPEAQVAVRNLNRAMEPGTPESVFGDERYLDYYDDVGDSAGFTGAAAFAAAFRYAATGSDADYRRFERIVRTQLLQFEATGIDGYLARFHFAGVPRGTPILNGKAMAVREEARSKDPFDIPAAVLPRLPEYYTRGLDLPSGHVPSLPSWIGHPSIDAYSGPMYSFPISYPLIRDPDLRARIAGQLGCFLKRLRIFKVLHISRNAELQAAIRNVISTGVLKLDPGDPDVSQADELWGFYLPQYNVNSAAGYPRECPATLAFDASPEETIDVLRPNFEDALITIFLRQVEGADRPDSMDFAFFPSLRSGDAIMLQSAALSAYLMTKDESFLKWRDEVLIKKANAKEVSRTEGAFQLPKACASYYRTPNVYRSHFVRLLIDGDPASRDFARMIWRDKIARREMSALADPLFEVLYAAASSERTAGLAEALDGLRGFGGTDDHLDDPRRNYALDASTSPVPGISFTPATDDEVRLCEKGFDILGVHIEGGRVDRSELFSSRALPLMRRPPDNFEWEKNPFTVVRRPDDAGRQQYAGLDFTEPYWIARYFGLLPDPHLALVWGPDE